MKYFHTFILYSVVIFAFTYNACNDPTVIGSDLLAGDQLDIQFTDTMTINTYSVLEDSIATYFPGIFTNIESFPVGILEDPIFGVSTSSVYAQYTLNSVFPNFDESGLALDSVVLVLPYNIQYAFGDLDETHSVEVYKMAENFPDTSTLYSDMEFMLGELIGEKDFLPLTSEDDSVAVFSPIDDANVNFPPQLRISLDKNGFDTLLFNADSTILGSVDGFENFLKGIHIKPTSGNKGMPSFNFRNSNSGIMVYYHRISDTTYFNYKFPIFLGNIVTANYKHDYSTSSLNLLDDYIGKDAPLADSLIFAQGMSGINFVIEVPYSEYLSDKVINKAEIILPIQFLSEDDPIYSPDSKLLVSEIKADGTYRLIDDFILARNRVGLDQFTDLAGGEIESDDTYRLNITTHMQDMSRGLFTENMRINIFLKSEQSSRVVLSGVGNSLAPAKLEVTFTNF